MNKVSAIALSAMMTLSAGTGIALNNGASYAADTTEPVTADKVISAETSWFYSDDNTVPAEGWNTNADFDDSSWKTGLGGFGFKRGAIGDLGNGIIPNTLLAGYKTDTTDDTPVYYFRTEFDIDEIDPASVQSLTGKVLYDDAATVTLNGVKIGGFDDGRFDEKGYGGSGAGAPKTGEIELTSYDYDMAGLNLKAEDNVLAVELHQVNATSSDIYMEMPELTVSSVVPEMTIKNVSLQVGEDETKRNITWYGESNDPSYVELAVMPEGWTADSEFPEANARKIRANHDDNSDGLYSNKAVMKNLTENTSYIYRVGNDRQWSEVFTFTTADLGKNDPFSFLFVGDPQIGASHNEVNDTAGWDNTLTNAINKFPTTSFILSAGDQINDKGDSEASQYDGFFAPDELQSYALALNEGNHDSGSTRYSDHYYIPNVSNLGRRDATGQQSGDYYNMYNGVLFIALNSNNMSVSEHRAFIKQALKENPDANWKIVSFHHSIFSAASHATDQSILELRSMLPSVFSDLDIDAVMMGHDHVYTRTYMMEGNDPVIPEGHNVSNGEAPAASAVDPEDGQTFYLTANSASRSKYYRFNNNSLTDFIAVKDQSNRPNITNVEVTENSLIFSTYFSDTEAMELLDTFTIEKTANIEIAKGKITKAKAGKGMIAVTAASLGDDVTYEFSYKKKGTKKWKTVTSNSPVKIINKLKKGKKYSVKVRGTRTVNGKTFTGEWSKAKTIKTKR